MVNIPLYGSSGGEEMKQEEQEREQLRWLRKDGIEHQRERTLSSKTLAFRPTPCILSLDRVVRYRVHLVEEEEEARGTVLRCHLQELLEQSVYPGNQELLHNYRRTPSFDKNNSLRCK